MSKSIGNILNVREAVSMWSNEAIRLFFLSHQYLNPADFSDTTMNEAEAALERLYITLKRANDLRKDGDGEDKQLAKSVQTFKERWIKTMCDDFNTADALGSLFELTRAINRSLDSVGWTSTLQSALEEINHFGSTLGILEYEPEEYLQGHKLEKSSSDITEEEIEELIKERNSARDEKNWKRADEIRDDLSNRGILLEDKAEDTIWRVKS
jgi:cysteinyl-tRNA synthetase